jgi:response regulator NasT
MAELYYNKNVYSFLRCGYMLYGEGILMKKTVIIADDEPITRMDICEILEEAGYEIVAEAGDGLDALELCRKFKPNLMLMDIKMPKLDGLKATKHIINENLVDAVVVLSAYSGSEFIEEAKEAGVMGYIIKPIDEKSLIPEIEVAMYKGRELRRIKDEVLKQKEEMEKRRIIDRAKTILMERHRIGEDEAYKRLRKSSMDKRCSLQQLAISIVEESSK